MSLNVGFKIEQWLLPRSRVLLCGLVGANFCLAVVLIVYEEPVVQEAPQAVSPIENKIRLVAEMPAVKPVTVTTPRECRTWGPEATPRVFDGLIAQLEANGGFPEVRETEVRADPDFLVYVGQLGSLDNARRVVGELTALKIDSYLIIRDGVAPILSVGVFSREKFAENQQKRLSELGYQVFTEQLERAQTVYLLSAHVKTDSSFYKTSTSACVAIAHNP